jgi:2-methylaconitate isomerase
MTTLLARLIVRRQIFGAEEDSLAGAATHVPMSGGEVQELGDFRLDGVAFPAAEVELEFLDPADDEAEAGAVGGATFPTGHHIDLLDVPGLGRIEATLINAGNPTVFVDAASLGLKDTELQGDVNGDKALLARAEAANLWALVRRRASQATISAPS